MKRSLIEHRSAASASEALGGTVVGALLAPLAAGASALRRGRAFHPRGVVYRGRVEPALAAGPLGEIGQRLAGPALVRLSGAIWKHGEHFDVLGVAIRLRSSDAIDPRPQPGDQDLLLATFRSPWSLPFAPLSTRAGDFFANDYYAVLPFDTRGLGRIDLRLRPQRHRSAPDAAHSRAERLAQDVAAGRARFAVELRVRTGHNGGAPGTWTEVAELSLSAPVDIDQERLRFSPFRSGRGLRPAGFLQNLRRATYPASQVGRRLATRLLEPRRLRDGTRAPLRLSTAFLARRAQPKHHLDRPSPPHPHLAYRAAHL